MLAVGKPKGQTTLRREKAGEQDMEVAENTMSSLALNEELPAPCNSANTLGSTTA